MELLGKMSIQSLRLVSCVATMKKFDPENQFPSLFTSLGKMEEDYCISLQERAKLYALTVPCRVAIPFLKQVQREIR